MVSRTYKPDEEACVRALEFLLKGRAPREKAAGRVGGEDGERKVQRALTTRQYSA